MPMKLYVGDIVKLKKMHPCGSEEWEILRAGMDFRIRCVKCQRSILLPRVDLEKSIKAVISSAHVDDGNTQ